MVRSLAVEKTAPRPGFERIPPYPLFGEAPQDTPKSAERALRGAVGRHPGLWLGGALAVGVFFGLVVIPRNGLLSGGPSARQGRVRALGDG